MIAASPESSRVSPQERNQKGIAVLNRPTTISLRQLRRSDARMDGRRTSGASVSAPSPTRPQIRVAGASSRTPTLMNMNEEPQIADSTRSIRRWRLLTSNGTYRRARS